MNDKTKKDEAVQTEAPLNDAPANPFKELIGQADAETRANLVKAVIEHLASSPDEQRELREAIKVAPMTVKRARNKDSNKDVQNFSRAYGDVVRTDPNFLPAVPEHIAEKGEWAIKKYHQRWLDGVNEHNAFEFEGDMEDQVHM